MLSFFGFSLLLSNPFCHLKITFFIYFFLYPYTLSFLSKLEELAEFYQICKFFQDEGTAATKTKARHAGWEPSYWGGMARND